MARRPHIAAVEGGGGNIRPGELENFKVNCPMMACYLARNATVFLNIIALQILLNYILSKSYILKFAVIGVLCPPLMYDMINIPDVMV